jgi:hypothetical protein
MKRVGEDLGQRHRKQATFWQERPERSGEAKVAGFSQRMRMIPRITPAFWLGTALAVFLGLTLGITQSEPNKDPGVRTWMSHMGNSDEATLTDDAVTLLEDLPIDHSTPTAQLRKDCRQVSRDATIALSDPPPKHYLVMWASSIRRLERDSDRCVADAVSNFHVRGRSEYADANLVTDDLLHVQTAYQLVSGNTGNSGFNLGPP